MKKAIAVAVAASFAACQRVAPPIGERRDIAPQRGGTLEMANFTDVRNLDPTIAFDAASLPILQLLYAPLVDYDDKGGIL